jgi:hypothetical protein
VKEACIDMIDEDVDLVVLVRELMKSQGTVLVGTQI